MGGQSSEYAGSLGYAWPRLRQLTCTPPGRRRHTRAWHATAPTLCRSALSSAAEVLAAAMAGGGAVGYEHRKHNPQAGVRHHPGRPRRAPAVPCALAPLCTHTRSPGRVRTAAGIMLRSVPRACKPVFHSGCSRTLVLKRSTPRGQAHLWRDRPLQAWAPVLALAWATQIASTSSTRWPRSRPANRRQPLCSIYRPHISARAAVGSESSRTADGTARQRAPLSSRGAERGGCDLVCSRVSWLRNNPCRIL